MASRADLAPFLLGWEYELRSRTAGEDVEAELPERFFEHFPEAEQVPDVVVEHTRAVVDAQRQREASWSDATDNDRLTAAFAALREKDLVAVEDAGLTLQDGWGQVGVNQRAAHRGAVLFHQQDVLHALRGEGLLLAFGAFEERPGAPSHEAIGREVFETLAKFGLSPRWSGEPSERILLTPFSWRKRLWTAPPEVEMREQPAPAALPLDAAALHTPEVAIAPRLVMAHRSSAGFNLPLTDSFEALWRQHGGTRGQLCHLGPPHIFVRAGESTEVSVRNAFTNLSADEASAPRRKARGFVIDRERASAVRTAPWPRPLCGESGGVGRVGLLVVSTVALREAAPDDLPIDLPRWSPFATVPDFFSWNYRTRASDPGRFTALPQMAKVAEERNQPALIALLERSQFGAFIQCEVSDARDLSHLQFGWAVAHWLLQGEGAVFDTLSLQWVTRAQLSLWEAGDWPTGRRFQLDREVSISVLPNEGQCLIITAGLEKFGRSDFHLRVPLKSGDAIPGWAEETVRHFATQLALGAPQDDGAPLRHGSMVFTFEAARAGRVLRRVE